MKKATASCRGLLTIGRELLTCLGPALGDEQATNFTLIVFALGHSQFLHHPVDDIKGHCTF
jgi:hypothetical protein